MAAKEWPQVLSASCPDEECCSRLYFPAYDVSVECPHCGQRHERSSLKQVEEVSNPGVALHTLLRNILVGTLVPKKGAETIKVRGLSNYHCKLLSPLLTRYGMDKKSGKAKLLSEMGQGPMFDCSLLGDRAFRIETELVEVIGYGKDISGSLNYLRETLMLIKAYNDGEDRLLPIHVDGDGHCLVHAVSRALVGRELFWHPLRCNLKKHLEDRLSEYKELFKEFIDEKEWLSIVEECDPEFLPPEGELLGLRNIHVFGLANVLRRPIVLLDSIAGMNSLGDYAALFLPSLVLPDKCRDKDSKFNKPICLSWSSSGRNHYIPLVGVKLGNKLPLLPRSLLPKAWGVPQSLIDHYIEFDANGCCIIGGDHSLSDSYVLRLASAMDEIFLEMYGVHPTLVADVHHYLYKRTGVVGIRPQVVVSATKRAVQERRLYRCLTCDAVCEHHMMPDWFKRGGMLYKLAVQNHGKLLPDKIYSFPLNGFTCRYNTEKDILVPITSKTVLEKCTTCQSTQVRLVRGDGMVEFKNGDRTKTPSNSNYCSCGYKHYWDGKEYDTQPQQINVTLEWSNKVIKETIPWWQYESDPALNSNVYVVASEVVNKHFPGVFGSEILMQKVVDQILDQTRLPDSMECDKPFEAQETDSSESSPCKLIIKGYKTLHKEELGVSEVERKLKDRIESHAAIRKTPVSFDKQTEDKSSSSLVPAVPASTNNEKEITCSKRPNFIRVVTSDGKQGQLSLGSAGITFTYLQSWIEKEFSIPPERQMLKIGFPPRELKSPEDAKTAVLPLSHGDRITVEIIPDVKTGVPREASFLQELRMSEELWQRVSELRRVNNDELSVELAGIIVYTKQKNQSIWEYAQQNPSLFDTDGVFYKQMKRDVGLVDGRHCHLPLMPDKTFTYNASNDRLELCLEPFGHFPVSENIETKVMTGQVGRTGRHESVPTDSHAATKHSVSSTIVNPERTTDSAKESCFTAGTSSVKSELHSPNVILRKGPGFSVLAPPETTDNAVEKLKSIISMLEEGSKEIPFSEAVSSVSSDTLEQESSGDTDTKPEKMDIDDDFTG